MDLKELDSFKMSDAIAFHDQLNPKLFHGQHLRPDVDEQLEVIAQDFLSELGIRDLDVKDVTISGSNAAFSYTPNSDLDLHLLVDLSQYSDDAVYQELFQAKKNLYNDSHDITINGIPVELYIQDSNQPVVSLGEYSILQNKWLKIPSKRRSNLDQTATKQKYEKLAKLAEFALHTKDLSKLKKVLETIKRYRQAGLDFGGEFGPENLAYKMLRSQGIITKLYDLRDKLHSQRLSIEGMYSIEEADEQMYKHTPTVEQLVIKYKVPKRDILIQLDKGIKVELEHTSERNIARKIALDHIGEDPHYYNKLAKANLEEDISRRGFLKGMGAAAVAGAADKAGAGQFTSSDDLNKDPESIEKVWKPRVAELQARCTGILNSFKSVASSVKPEWVPILDQIKLEITLGDTSLKRSPARANTHTRTTTQMPPTWAEIKKQNPNEYSVDVWSKVYPNISYRGSATPESNPIIDVQIRPNGAIVSTTLRTPSKDPTWDQAVLGGISKTKIIPTRTVPADKKLSNQIIRINFPIRFWSDTNKQPSVTSKSTYRIFVETTVFWDAPDSTLAWVLGHEVGHLVNNHQEGASMAQRRQNELEADEVGAVLAQKIGYDRANFFQWLYNAKAENLKNSTDSTHPDPIDRVNNLKQKTGFELAAVKYIDSMVQQFQNGLAESSGYIPSEKQKNDPRFSTALTIDVNPYSIKKNAKAFGWLTSRAGIPPTAKPSGKIS